MIVPNRNRCCPLEKTIEYTSSGSVPLQWPNVASQPGGTKGRLDHRTLTPSSRATTPARRGQRAPKPVSAPQESPLVTQQTRGQTWRIAKRPRTEVHRPPARSPVERGLTILAFAIAVLLVLLFGFDLATGWPFYRHSLLMDVAYLACGTLLTYLSWNTYQGLR
jgi:hypothetical protein